MEFLIYNPLDQLSSELNTYNNAASCFSSLVFTPQAVVQICPVVYDALVGRDNKITVVNHLQVLNR